MSNYNTNGFATVAVLVVVAAVVGLASVLIVKQHDKEIEELSEAVIEHELGLPAGSVDITPASPE